MKNNNINVLSAAALAFTALAMAGTIAQAQIVATPGTGSFVQEILTDDLCMYPIQEEELVRNKVLDQAGIPVDGRWRNMPIVNGPYTAVKYKQVVVCMNEVTPPTTLVRNVSYFLDPWVKRSNSDLNRIGLQVTLATTTPWEGFEYTPFKLCGGYLTPGRIKLKYASYYFHPNEFPPAGVACTGN